MTEPNAVDTWLLELCEALDLPTDLAGHRELLLDVARDVAHGVARPAAPLTTFLIGYAAGQSDDPGALQRAAEIVTQRALERGE